MAPVLTASSRTPRPRSFSGGTLDGGGAPLYSSAIGGFVIGLSPMPGGVVTTPPPEQLTSPYIARFFDNILSLVPGATEAIVDQYIWNTVEEFSIRSTYFRTKVYWQMAVGVPSVDLSPFGADWAVVWVIEQWGLHEFRIDPPAQLIDLQTPPLATRNGWAILVLKPQNYDRLRLGLIPELFSTWFETMLDGVLFRLFGMPTRPWSNPQMAAYHGQRFRQGINRARDIAERLHTNQQSPARVYPYYARGRRKN